MVLSMLSAIQNVKLPSAPPQPPSSTSPTTDERTKKDIHRASNADMSRRKQRNPKPIFNSNENDQDYKESNEADASKTNSQSEDEISVTEDIHSMVKVEINEPKTPPPTSNSAPPLQQTPPPSTSSGLRLPTMPPLQRIGGGNAEQMMLNHTAEMLAKQNMFCFGDVSVAEHPDAPPVPMVIPMVYLYPLPSSSNRNENVKYRMFVPLGTDLPSSAAAANPLMSSSPPNLPKLEKNPESNGHQGLRSGETTPLDLSKSPDNNNRRSCSESISDNEDLMDGRILPPPLRLAQQPRSISRDSSASKEDAHRNEIEAQLQFFKAKQLEFLKDQHQKQAAALAAAQAAAVAAQQKSRCEECNINFSKHQNYIAHKKYYCSAQATAPPQSSSKGNGAQPIVSDNEDDNKSESDDSGKNHQHSRKLSPPGPATTAAIMAAAHSPLMMGLTSPGAIKDRKEDKDSSKDSPAELKSSQVSPNTLLIPPPTAGGGLTTPPALPHFVCEGCGIKFKSVSNLQAHQARYCAGLRKASEDALEAMMFKQKQQQQQQQAAQAAAAAAMAAMSSASSPNAVSKSSLPMLEMMNLLNAKSNMVEQDKLSSLMMSSMAAAAMVQAANNSQQPNSNSSPGSSEDYYCFLCGYKEESVEHLKDHINLHFIGKVKRKEPPASSAGTEPEAKKVKKVEQEDQGKSDELSTSPKAGDSENQLKCNACDIGFSHLSNFVAHKKYYCRGLQTSKNEPSSTATLSSIQVKSESALSPDSNNGKESPK